MKLCRNNSCARKQFGITLIECMVYLMVFMMLSGAAMCAFYFCLDGSKKLMSATDDISAALAAGERWRADVRNATGTISIEQTASGEVVKIPEGKEDVVYTFAGGKLQRLTGSQTTGKPLLPKVKSSEITSDVRGGVKAWKWELELAQHAKDAHLRLLFTFEAVQKAP